MHKSKIFSIVLMVGLLLLPIMEAGAGTSDTVAVKVTISQTLSVNITEDTLQLGSVIPGGTTLSGTAVTVTNNGSGVNETYSLSLSNPSGWTASQTATGAETYILNTAFSNVIGGISWSLTNHALSITPTVCTASKFAGDQTGVSVPYNSARKLWFQFRAPTSTSVTTEQSITVTVTAQLG
jgi:hypothetical protein